ncbi:hypothetical protein [Shinella sp. DD12]|uniref:hypothetical protein n=1 Tax=Shinella sp. DD12 TaxID=1410620 RepID=UPI000437A3F7|nr:hypothetical protein [Shinella sp. DD12]EYR81855.1 hypothetical protein SHLA_4c001470 [Shinella sp. DD12]
MEIDDVELAVSRALRDGAGNKPAQEFGFAIQPFRGTRLCGGEFEDAVAVVGVHFNGKGDYSFICVASDGVGETYVTQEENLLGVDLPYGFPPAPAQDANPSDP